MFPCAEIESYYRSYREGYTLVDEFAEVAQLCEEWLLSFQHDEGAYGSAMDSLIANNSDYPNDDRLDFAIAMAIAISSGKTAKIVGAFWEYIEDERFYLRSMLEDIIEKSQITDGVNALEALSHCGSFKHFETLSHIYGLGASQVRIAAVALDHPQLFKMTLEKIDGDEAKNETSLGLLSYFPPAPDSCIHRMIVNTKEKEEQFLHSRLDRLRCYLFGESTDNIGYQRETSLADLRMKQLGNMELKVASFEDFMPIYLDEDFTKILIQHKCSFTARFFGYNYQALPSEHLAPIFHEVTQKFFEAGLSAEFIISQGIMMSEGVTSSLPEVMEQIGGILTSHLSYYEPVFRDYLDNFSVEEIVRASQDANTLARVYKITQRHDMLEKAGASVRERVIESDLGI